MPKIIVEWHESGRARNEHIGGYWDVTVTPTRGERVGEGFTTLKDARAWATSQIGKRETVNQ